LESQSATFVAHVHGKPFPDVQWYHNTAALQCSNSVLMENEDTAFKLTLLACGTGQSGQIQLIATNKAGTASSEAHLLVKGVFLSYCEK